MSVKLNLGSGGDYIEGYINVDLYAQRADHRYDIRKLPYADNSVDEIRAFHVIEHFNYLEAHDILYEWLRVLKPGSRLHLETPDFLESCKEFIKADENGRWKLYGHFFSEAWTPGNIHQMLYTEYTMRESLTRVGYKNINRLPPSSTYLAQHPPHIFLNLEAYKL